MGWEAVQEVCRLENCCQRSDQGRKDALSLFVVLQVMRGNFQQKWHACRDLGPAETHHGFSLSGRGATALVNWPQLGLKVVLNLISDHSSCPSLEQP